MLGLLLLVLFVVVVLLLLLLFPVLFPFVLGLRFPVLRLFPVVDHHKAPLLFHNPANAPGTKALSSSKEGIATLGIL